MHATSWRVAQSAVLALVVAGACHPDETTDTNNLRPDVLYCEDALTYLTSCCPDFHPDAIRCHHYEDTYDHQGCGSYTYRHTEEYPALSRAESQCIVSTSCDALRLNGICARAQTATPYTESSYRSHEDGDHSEYDPAGGSSQTHPAVCP
jgi:hypothetical protein